MATQKNDTEWTGLNVRQCDALRELVRERRKNGDIGFQLPTSPLALVRFYWSEIEKKPCPEHLLEGVPGYEPGPNCEDEAKVMAEELGLDLRYILPTGPGGKVLREDVLKHVQSKFKKYAPGPGGKKGAPAAASAGLDDFLGEKG